MGGETRTTVSRSADPWAGVPRFAEEQLAAFAAAAFTAAGLGEADATKAADFLLIADRRGIDSHGVARLTGFVRRLRAGLIDPAAELTIIRETPATIAMSANNGLGLLLAPAAMERCIAKAEATGLCLATVRASNHFGIAGAYALMAAERGLGGLAMTNASPIVVPVFGAKPMIGTNPLAFAVPTGAGRPLVLDMSTSTVAWGKIVLGVLLLVLAGRQWRSKPAPGADPAMPSWMTGIDAFSPGKALGLGLLLAGVNPKNLLLTLAAAVGLAGLGLSTTDAVVSLIVFVVVASLTIAGPVVYYVVGGAHAKAKLDSLKSWLAVNNAAVMAVLFVIFGVDLIAKGIPPLTG